MRTTIHLQALYIFFPFRVLAHDIEEENYKIEVLITLWETEMIKSRGVENFVSINTQRYELFRRMNFRALVSRKCCEEVKQFLLLFHFPYMS